MLTMDDVIRISQLNDFIFCPASIYFHNLYGNQTQLMYQCTDQTNGTDAHKAVDHNTYSTKKDTITNMDVYCDKYRLTGKIDIFDKSNGLLTERKKKIVRIYDGYIFQLYGQYFAMSEMGYSVISMRLYSMDDNKIYPVLMPKNNIAMFEKFESTITAMHSFEMSAFAQDNKEKCHNCVYEPACDRGLT